MMTSRSCAQFLDLFWRGDDLVATIQVMHHNPAGAAVRDLYLSGERCAFVDDMNDACIFCDARLTLALPRVQRGAGQPRLGHADGRPRQRRCRRGQ